MRRALDHSGYWDLRRLHCRGERHRRTDQQCSVVLLEADREGGGSNRCPAARVLLSRANVHCVRKVNPRGPAAIPAGDISLSRRQWREAMQSEDSRRQLLDLQPDSLDSRFHRNVQDLYRLPSLNDTDLAVTFLKCALYVRARFDTLQTQFA
jgi:hypothetical protein